MVGHPHCHFGTAPQLPLTGGWWTDGKCELAAALPRGD